MPDALLRVYHTLPPAAQNVAASIRGLQLRRRRYGPETRERIEEARERETWTEEKWRQWQSARIAALLNHAATNVPWYREHWRERRQRGDRSSWEELRNWPLLDKDTVRANPEAFIADSARGQELFVDRTSGTTGKPLSIWSGTATLRAWYALYELRCRLWHGVSRELRWAMLGGQLVVPAGRAKPPYWVWNAGLRQLYLSSAHLTPRNLSCFAQALRDYRITHITGYPSALAVLAGAGVDSGLLDVAIANAEPVLPGQREAVRQGLGCPLRETYGMAEMVAGASECSAGRLHAWPDAGFIEVLSEDGFPGAAGSGELVCTGLLNAEMPLIRYRTGDRGRMPQFGDCGCGRSLPFMDGIEGRNNDALIASDGRRVFWLNPVLYGLPLQEAQIVQTRRGAVTVRYVPAGDRLPDSSVQLLKQRLESRLGGVSLSLEPVPAIPRTAGGKFRAVICEVPESDAIAAGAI